VGCNSTGMDGDKYGDGKHLACVALQSCSGRAACLTLKRPMKALPVHRLKRESIPGTGSQVLH
jgi:hypothetical protein